MSAPVSTAAGNPATVAVPRTPALVAGSALLLMAGLAGWAGVGVLLPLVTAPDPVVTIVGSVGAVRAAAGALVIVAVLDVVVAWALFEVLRPTQEALARVAAWLRTAYAAGFVLAVSHVLVAVEMVAAADGTDAELGRTVKRELLTFQTMWEVGLLLVGLHLLLIGVALWRGPGFPRWLGAFVVLCGVGYAFDASAVVVVPGPLWSLTTVTFVGEVALAIWLLVRAFRGETAAPSQVRS